jgi:cell wall-associated NlpC family hydrolase
MPVTTRRTGLSHALSPASVERSTQPTGRVVARHRKPTKSAAAPRAAAAMTLSVGLAVSAGAGLNTDTAQAATPGQIRGNTPTYKKPLLRFGDSGKTVSYVQYRLRIPRSGWYGKATVQAVGNFQRAVKLPRSGTMTVRTWDALYYIAKHPPKKKKKTSGSFHARVLKEAYKLRGTPYRYGGTTPRGFDCSGYTGYVYKKAGKKIPRTSRAQYAATKHLSRRSAKPGDLVFFKNGSGRVYHVGIFAGGNMLWHSSKPGVPVRKAKIWSKRVAFGRA